MITFDPAVVLDHNRNALLISASVDVLIHHDRAFTFAQSKVPFESDIGRDEDISIASSNRRV